MKTYTADVVLAAAAEVGEGPCWDAATERLIWVDILAHQVHTFDPVTGVDTAVDVGADVGAAVPTTDGSLILALPNGLARLHDGVVTHIVDIEADLPGNRFNDAKTDPRGRLFADTMHYDQAPGQAGLYKYDGVGVITVASGVGLGNGLGWSPDGAVMYFTDSLTNRVDQFDYDLETGTATDRRPLIQFDLQPGQLPDGLCVDDDGCLWVAIFGCGEVRRVSPDGDVIGVVSLPASQITSCAFGPGGVLYVTSAAMGVRDREPLAGALFAVRTDTTGRPATPFRWS
ncbi:SMP-30/gluconolactonase/LRE family protein [Microbacterium rhizosphaerae]|uniref:SMP-30/gluconolactonase/LRE family protein n=1 Tax=Microbacterium rhizosphaerae TaxID=1678237 RepID=A0ABZ0SKU3_9MICO|nr:SMP-30/gluconolactonase/LRE family protein [Microbacterium rhizosphaerae]WPR89115.1 SMP-30/gluconolactonase/LRE family protein [Microbacterium rhizosphaerae]